MNWTPLCFQRILQCDCKKKVKLAKKTKLVKKFFKKVQFFISKHSLEKRKSDYLSWQWQRMTWMVAGSPVAVNSTMQNFKCLLLLGTMTSNSNLWPPTLINNIISKSTAIKVSLSCIKEYVKAFESYYFHISMFDCFTICFIWVILSYEEHGWPISHMLLVQHISYSWRPSYQQSKNQKEITNSWYQENAILCDNFYVDNSIPRKYSADDFPCIKLRTNKRIIDVQKYFEHSIATSHLNNPTDIRILKKIY